MISIVLYGRNDSYGYNLHKRAALSLNCMAEILTDPSDEILFVDYNTPDDFPTFPEAIQDTLTRRARELLRILRVRPHIHERFKSRTRLVALEPIARNVAVRRSLPGNRWILSTNTDMIFVTHGNRSLSEIARGLPPGFYHAPRIEIPEVLWEGFDRRAPANIIKTVRDWGSTLHLNEIVLGSQFIRYDGPGDFQLLLRKDLFENDGFDEEMLLGWHVDSNIAARMQLKYGEVGDAGEHVFGYHCDHTRQVTPAHSHSRVQNDWRRFVTDVTMPNIPLQAATWGCPDDAIEESRLASDIAGVYVQALRDVIGSPLAEPKVVHYSGESYNKVDYEPKHLLPFLADMFVSMPRATTVAWYGLRVETLQLFAGIWEKLGFKGRILLEEPLIKRENATAAIRYVSTAEALAKADIFLFDFGGLPPSERGGKLDRRGGELRRSFRRAVREERRRLSNGMAPRRMIALNAINNEFEGFVCGAVAAAATPFATHMRHGFVLPERIAKEDWLPQLSVGEAGVRIGNETKSDPGKVGWIVYGPFKYLEEGRYLLSLQIAPTADQPDRPETEPLIVIEVVAGPELVSVHLLRRRDLNKPNHKFVFDVMQSVADGISGIETRVGVLRPTGIVLRSLIVEPVAKAEVPDQAVVALTIADLLQTADWLPFLRTGPLGSVDDQGVCGEVGPQAYVTYGPYWSLPAGRYEVTAALEPSREPAIPEHWIEADVIAGPHKLAIGSFHLGVLAGTEGGSEIRLRLPFELHQQNAELQVQTRIWSSGEQRFRIRSLAVRQLEYRPQEGLFPSRLLGEIGSRLGGETRAFGKRVGFVGHSQTLALEPGVYRVTLQVDIEPDGSGLLRKPQTCLIALVKHRYDILAATAIRFGVDSPETHTLNFEVPSDSEPTTGIEFALQVVAPANITLRKLTLERVAIALHPTNPAVCELENWLPFLKTRSSAQADDDGVVVRAGRAEYAVYGPYWALPPGAYEMIASIVPQAPDPKGRPVVTADVTTENGLRQLAATHWHLGHFQGADGQKAVEFRLPFSVAADLPGELRTIETRIYTQGDGNFRIRSLTVKVDEAAKNLAVARGTAAGSDARHKDAARPASSISARDWLTDFHVSETGQKTKRGVLASAGAIGNIGYIQRAFPPGRYEAILRVERAGGDSDPAAQLIIVVGGHQVVARIIEFAPRTLGRLRIPRGPYRISTFEVPVGLPHVRTVQIRVENIGTGAFLIRSLTVKPKTKMRDLRDRAAAEAAVWFRKLQRAVK